MLNPEKWHMLDVRSWRYQLIVPASRRGPSIHTCRLCPEAKTNSTDVQKQSPRRTHHLKQTDIGSLVIATGFKGLLYCSQNFGTLRKY